MENHIQSPTSTIRPLLSVAREETEPHNKQIENIREFLQFLGEDPDRPGIQKTPQRFLKAFQFLTSGYHQTLAEVVGSAVFAEPEARDLVLVRDINIFSTCEHHLLPIIGKVHVAYLPNGHVLGLSKVARICEMYARRLQLQERLTAQIADAIQEVLNPRGVAVLLDAEHMCMAMRGVQKTGSRTATTSFRGLFESDSGARDDFFRALRHSG